MTTTTAPNRSPNVPAKAPAANLQRATAPSLDAPDLVDHAAHIVGKKTTENFIDALLFPVTSALDAFEQVDGASKAISILREDTSAASLKLNETAECELKGKVQLLDGVLYGQVAGKVAVSKKPDGYEVATTLNEEAGMSLTTKKQGEPDAKSGPGAKGEASVVLGVTVTHKVKTAVEANAKVSDFKTKSLINLARTQMSGPKGPDEPTGGMLGVYDVQRDTYAGAASVKTMLEAKAEAEVSLGKEENASLQIAAELGLKVETAEAFTMDLKQDENGAKSVTFSTSIKVAVEVEAVAELEPLEQLAGSFTGLGVASEATIMRSKTYPLPNNFNSRDASSLEKVLRAAQGEGKDEVSVEVKAQVGKSQHVSGKLTVQGDLGDAFAVAAAALGKGDAKGIVVTGEVTRSVETPASGSVGLGGVVSVGADLKRTRELQTVQVNDTNAFVKELGKKAFAGALDSSAHLVNAR